MVDEPGGGPEPSAMLKARVVRSLRDERLLAPRWYRTWRSIGAVAAAFLMFIAGYAYGRKDAAPDTAMSRFVLLLYEDSTFHYPGTGAEAVAEYSAWARSLEERGYLEFAEQLGPTSASLPAASNVGQLASQISGMFVIRAKSLEEARRLADESPHLRYGGAIALRPVAH